MTLILETGFRTSLADAITTYIDAGTAPELVFETVGDAIVATIVLNATASFDAAAAGVITMADQPLTDASAVGGTTVQFSIYQNTAQAAAKVLEGTVGVSSSDINISSTVIGATDSVELTTFTITVPAS